jgi:hypothetical protein
MFVDKFFQELLGFVHALRVLVRQHPRTCASLGMPAHLCDDRWAGPGWTQKVGWLSDACVSFAAFAGTYGLFFLSVGEQLFTILIYLNLVSGLPRACFKSYIV